MEKLILAALYLLAISCSTTEQQEYDYFKNSVKECGFIIGLGEDQRGDYIMVKMPHYTSIQKDRYQVEDYQSYQINSEICNFVGITKQPL